MGRVVRVLTVVVVCQGPGGAQLPRGREPPGEGGGLRAGAADARRHVHGARRRQVPHQVDRARGARLQYLQHQVGRVGLRHPAVGDRHLRHVALPRCRPRRRLPHAREGAPRARNQTRIIHFNVYYNIIEI